MIPASLDTMEPGVMLAAILETIEVDELSGRERIVVLRARQCMMSHYQAQMYADMAGVVDAMGELEGFDDEQWAADAAAAEIRVALRLTRRAADTELGLALDLRDRLPRVWDSLTAGDIDLRRA